MPVSPTLRFSDSTSFRLFTEGVKALQSYEQTAEQGALKKAAERFNECVSRYRDVLPRLYLGIVRTYQGEEFGEAVTLLQEVINRNIPELQATAKYYMAEAHVATYTPENIARADDLLNEVILDSRASEADHLRAEGLRTFNYIRQHLWRNRRASTDLTKDEQEAVRRLELFKKHFEEAKEPEELKASLWADYWNVDGLLNEFRANRVREGPERSDLIKRSLAAFDNEVKYGANRADAISNEARVYFELLHDAQKATELCHEVLQIRENDSFANLLLGRINMENNPAEAVAYFEKAETKFKGEAALSAAQCYVKLGKLDDAIAAYARVPRTDRRFADATYSSGVVYERLGKLEEARKSYRLVPESDKEFFEKAKHAIESLDSQGKK